MEVLFEKGKIITNGYFYEDVPYDVAANALSVCFDGKGGISRYYSPFAQKNYIEKSNCVSIYKDGERIGAYTDKTVCMIGRTQEVRLKKKDCDIVINQFINKDNNAVFAEITFSVEKPSGFTVVYGVSEKWFIPVLVSDGNCVYDEENMSFIFSVDVSGKKTIRFVTSYDKDKAYCDGLLLKFNEKQRQVREEIDNVIIPDSAENEEEKALYLSALFCCLENYKEHGNFKGFAAGVNYLNPLRTYYRDSYWTILSVYAYDISLVKEQILTLARGVSEDGHCPSAVRTDSSVFWENHYDSPSFFVMMVFDYINHSGDTAILSETVNGKSIFELCVLVLNTQVERTDATGLLLKKGPYNKLDWADEVNRNGYVSYDEALYYRALWCMDKICVAVGNDGNFYKEKAEKVKNSINAILWNEEKGYYVNYIDGDFVEDNLSVDTVLMYLFGIADKLRTEKMFNAMERLLETKNNSLQKAGDYGVMCVYPFYKSPYSAYFKSSRDYEYHNGANWPYWSAIYAYAKYLAGKEYRYPLTSWFTYNIKKGNFTPIEYFSPCRVCGSMLQAWSGAAAFVFDFIGKPSFFEPLYLK